MSPQKLALRSTRHCFLVRKRKRAILSPLSNQESRLLFLRRLLAGKPQVRAVAIELLIRKRK